ncbi:VC1465 family Xer recombination activation factor [Xanthomonas populi]
MRRLQRHSFAINRQQHQKAALAGSAITQQRDRGFTREQAARFLNVSVRTIGHWETGRARPTYAAFKLLRVYRHGDLIHPEWRSCFINHRGALVTAEGREIKATDLDWLSLLFRRAHMMGPLLRELDALKKQFQILSSARPAPKWCQNGAVMTLRTAQYDSAKRELFCVETLALQWFPCDSWVALAASGRLPRLTGESVDSETSVLLPMR